MLILILLVMASSLVIGQAYKWTDKDGNVHFGDSPPDDADAVPLSMPRTPTPEQAEEVQLRFEKSVAKRVERERIAQPSEVHKIGPNDTLSRFSNQQPSCNNVVAKDASVEFNREIISNLLKRVEGTWAGSVEHIKCDKTRIKSSRCWSLAASMTLPSQERQQELDDCRRNANYSADLDVKQWKAEGKIVAEWEEEMGGLYLRSTGDKNIEEKKLFNRYVGAYKELRYFQLPKNSRRSNIPNLAKAGASAQLLHSSDECVGFLFSQGGGIVIRPGRKSHVLSVQGAVHLCVNGDRLRLVTAPSHKSPDSFTVWEMKR